MRPGWYDRVRPVREFVPTPATNAPEQQPDTESLSERAQADAGDDLPEFEESVGTDETADESDDADAEGVVYTAGAQSTVMDESGSRVGHALLLDADDADPLDVFALAEHLDGVTAIFESSEGSFHLWNMSVRDLQPTILRMLDLRVCDDAHAGASFRRGYAVLRFVAKVHENGENYKQRPQLRDVWVNEDDTDLAQSRPHAEAVLSLADEQNDEQNQQKAAERLRDALDSEALRWVGDAQQLLTDQYATVSDDAKADIRRE
jgi:hypothetical protein